MKSHLLQAFILAYTTFFTIPVLNSQCTELYGLLGQGGENNNGAIFKTDGNGENLKIAFSPQSSENGSYFTGSLVQAPNGKLYGMTARGGVNNLGILYEWDTGENKFSRKIDFNGAELGASPWGCGLTVNDNYSLYGMTGAGGANNMGILFEWNYKTNTYTKKLDFNGLENGACPGTSLLKADNGKLYGLTVQGGQYDWGVLFEWNPITNAYSKIFDFNDPLGSQPCQSVIQASNGRLYGMTSTGGSYGDGTIFEWDITGNTYTKKIDFNRPETGSTPMGSLFEADNGLIYGMTSLGGTFGEGVLFEWNPETNAFTKITDFDGPINGAQPDGRIMQAANGKLYGVANGGENSGGVLFEWDPKTRIFARKFDFDQNNGSYPYFTNLVEVKGHSKSIRISACENYISPSGKYIWTTTGIYRDTIPGAQYCDSIITVDLTINHSSTGTIYPYACESYKSPSEKYTWTESGVYFDTIPTTHGCDSIISIYLTVLRSSSAISSETACKSYDFNGRMVNTSGIYIDTIPNAAGCDSVITLNLQIDRVDTTVIQDMCVLESLDRLAGHQWIDCDNSNLPIDGETHFTFTARENGRYAVIVSNGVCVDTSSMYEIIGTGINGPSGGQITLFPNPTSGNFTIDLGKDYPEALVTITRYDGQVIRDVRIHNSRMVDLNFEESAGIYMVTIIAESTKETFKIYLRL